MGLGPALWMPSPAAWGYEMRDIVPPIYPICFHNWPFFGGSFLARPARRRQRSTGAPWRQRISIHCADACPPALASSGLTSSPVTMAGRSWVLPGARGVRPADREAAAAPGASSWQRTGRGRGSHCRAVVARQNLLYLWGVMFMNLWSSNMDFQVPLHNQPK